MIVFTVPCSTETELALQSQSTTSSHVHLLKQLSLFSAASEASSFALPVTTKASADKNSFFTTDVVDDSGRTATVTSRTIAGAAERRSDTDGPARPEIAKTVEKLPTYRDVTNRDSLACVVLLSRPKGSLGRWVLFRARGRKKKQQRVLSKLQKQIPFYYYCSTRFFPCLPVSISLSLTYLHLLSCTLLSYFQVRILSSAFLVLRETTGCQKGDAQTPTILR